MDIIQEIRNFVEEECKKPSSKYGYEPFTFHFIPVVEYAGELADKLRADKEAVVISAWLHDIGSMVYGREDHHITGAKIAEQKLEQLGYPREKIEKVKDYILSHRGSQNVKPQTIEAQILVEADTLSAFNDIIGLFQCAFAYENLSREEAKNSVRQKLINKYNQLKFEDSKKIIRPKFEAAMLLLE